MSRPAEDPLPFFTILCLSVVVPSFLLRVLDLHYVIPRYSLLLLRDLDTEEIFFPPILC